jgi:hypothetical protein
MVRQKFPRILGSRVCIAHEEDRGCIRLCSHTRVPRTTARTIKPPKQKFAIFSKCLENSKNFKEYYSRVSDYEYLL